MPHLICPGFAKAGTTLLHSLLSESTDFQAPFEDKERNYFRLDNESVTYQSCFHEPFSDELVSFECSPTYLSAKTRGQRGSIAEHIRENMPDDTSILIAVRHPIRRALSHYFHQLQRAALFGNGRWTRSNRNLNTPYTLSFLDALQLDGALMGDLHWSVLLYEDLFGQDRTRFFFLEKDAAGFASFYEELRSHFGLAQDPSWRNKDIPKIGDASKNRVPQYFAAGTDSGVVTTDEGELELPDGVLYIASDLGHDVVQNVDPLVLRSLNAAQKSWTRSVTAADLHSISARILDDDLKHFVDHVGQRFDVPDYLSMEFKDINFELVPADLTVVESKLSTLTRLRPVKPERNAPTHETVSAGRRISRGTKPKETLA